MDAISSLALAGGLSWASGLRLYLTVFVVGLLAKFGYIDLPAALNILSNPVVIGVSGILVTVEFLADKIPYVDSAWDSIQTFIRIPAGALLAMGAINSGDPMIATLAALVRRQLNWHDARHQSRQPRTHQHLARTRQQYRHLIW